jgi:hypothetical protein
MDFLIVVCGNGFRTGIPNLLSWQCYHDVCELVEFLQTAQF